MSSMVIVVRSLVPGGVAQVKNIFFSTTYKMYVMGIVSPDTMQWVCVSLFP